MFTVSRRFIGSSERLIGRREDLPAKDSAAHYVFSIKLDTSRENSNELVLAYDKANNYKLIGAARPTNKECVIKTYNARPLNEFLLIAIDNEQDLEAEAVDNCKPEVVWL
ncbi:hypothetical protein CBQ28_17115 [Pseudoalteromonas sp. GCY]|uniref:hypothetical protein n=1 Tax=Pseudoalteromonas sp. GCY TaxID=2003316 RepID=UPI000BFEED79|nr:hypothetical protein [Pseudoalteromonas sp. GCY]PHI35983.1 hypothetical protein CBQ28_17115 [Pseudoalteromonas sp. GCY]QQQ68537.1 hypothetical protein JJQ94_12390 [Pseudoalteromonas sp. GCY]